MNDMLQLLHGRIDGRALHKEVEEELRFHVEMRARDLQSQGFSAEESLELATRRFGDFSAVKKQCVQISVRKSLRFKAMKTLCATTLLLGIGVTLLTEDFRVARIGQVLIMIAVTGSVLMFVKVVSVQHLLSDRKLLRLGLHDSDVAS